MWIKMWFQKEALVFNLLLRLFHQSKRKDGLRDGIAEELTWKQELKSDMVPIITIMMGA